MDEAGRKYKFLCNKQQNLFVFWESLEDALKNFHVLVTFRFILRLPFFDESSNELNLQNIFQKIIQKSGYQRYIIFLLHVLDGLKWIG